MPKKATVIDIDDPTGPRFTGLRGKLDRLFREYTIKAQALRIAAEIVDADDRKTALESAPTKFLQAVNHRNGAAGRPIVRNQRRGAKSKPGIHGKHLSVFLLNRLDDAGSTTRPALLTQLHAAGSAGQTLRGLNGIFATFQRQGYVRKMADGGYRRTAKGASYLATLQTKVTGADASAPGA